MSVDTVVGGRYRVERVLGDGAMAKVLLAEDGELGRQVAVKLLDEQLAGDAAFRARFAREARVAASISHPNVVAVYDVGEADGRPFIVMEHVDGESLAAVLSRGRLPLERGLAIGIQLAQALEAAHAAGIVHRDLKPGNLIERSDGTIKIADFGIARLLEGTELTEAGTIVGTAAYLAPEQAEDGEITPAADVFALGVLLYELLTARQPWKVDSLAELARRESAPRPELPPETPWALREAVERSLETEPAARPTVPELAALLEAPDDEATLVLPRTVPQRGSRRERRSVSRAAWAALIVSAALLLGAVAAVVATRGGDEGSSGTTVADVRPLQDGPTPTEDARNLAEWLRANGG